MRTRIALLAALCVAVAVALVSLGSYITVRDSLYSQAAENLLTRAHDIASKPPVGGEIGVDLNEMALADFQLNVIDTRGQSLAKPETLQAEITQTEIDVAAGREADSYRVDGKTDSTVVAVPYVGYARGTALVLGQSLAPIKATLNRLNIVFLVIGGAGVLIAALAGTAAASAGLVPIRKLTEATERVARTIDLRPIPVTGDDELARLTLSFNAMLGALAESQERQRRLVADAGHELRTPLTSMRTNLELLLAAEKPGAPRLSAEDKREIQEDVRAQLDELTTLIGDLVELAREDPPDVVHEPVDLVEVVERALDRARRRASDVEFDVVLQPWTLYGDSSALERAVLNLLDNAVKFSPPGGTVRVELQQLGDGTAVINVADAGPGIAEADLPHVFDRFYRSSEARTLPGSGLGLAIVRQVAQRHGGGAYAARSAQGGALLTIRLPGQPGQD
nr:HAMP domain-containing sensor histidine kinase [Goodfellowiella coeruleoviolacea]